MTWTGWANVFVTPNFVIVYCGVIVVWAAFLLIRLLFRYRTINRDLLAVHKAMMPMGNEERFARGFASLSKEVRKHRSLAHAWSEFEEHLLPPDPGEQDPDAQFYRNTRESASYFNMGTIVEPRINLRFYNAVPNYLTGLGILGTFAGLTAGIALAKEGMGSGADTAQTQDALRRLLDGASLAFWTSIAGLVSAITFLLTERNLVAELQSRLNGWVESLDRGLRLITPESIAVKQLGELRAQTADLKFVSTDLAVAIGQQLDERMVSKLTPEIQRMAAAIDQLVQAGKQTNEDLLKSVVDDLGEVVTGAAGREIGALKNALETVTSTLAETVTSLNGARESMGSTLQEVSSSVTAYMRDSKAAIQSELESALASAVKNFEGASAGAANQLETAGLTAAATLNETLERLTEAAKRLEGAHDATEQLRSSAADSVRELERATATLRDSSEEFGNILRSVQAAAGAFQESGTKTEHAGNQIRAAAAETLQAVERLEAAQTQIAAAWEEYRTRFEKIDDGLAAVMGQFDDSVANYAERMSTFVQQMDRELSQAIQTVAGAVQQLSDVVEELPVAGQKP